MCKSLFILALIATIVASAPQKRTSTFLDTHSVLAEMDKGSFGSTILSVVALNMASESPVEEIQLEIQGIITDLQNQQKDDDKDFKEDEEACNQLITGLNGQIKSHTESINTLTKNIADNEEILAQAKIDFQQATSDYDETVQSINSGTAQRESENTKWSKEDAKNTVSITTLDEGAKLINHLIHGVSFAQVKVRYDKVLEKLLDNQNKHVSLFKPLITSLSQLSSKLNYDNVRKILELIQNIKSGIVEEQVNSRVAEEKAQNDWNTLLAHLTEQKQSLGDKINRLTALISSTDKLLGELRDSLSFHQGQLASNEALLASTTTTCNERKTKYETDTSERGREQEILTKLNQHLAERYQAVQEYVGSRPNQF